MYRAVGGSERTRTIVMWLTHWLFLVETSIWVAVSIAMDRDARRHPLRLARSLARLPKSPFASPRAVRQLLQYHRRGFHPNDRDTKQLVVEWRETLFGNDGELVDALAS
jgi:hypothetical protein